MKKIMKKITAIALTIAMAMSGALPAFADDSGPTKKESSIFQTAAFQDFKENGLPSTTLKEWEEKRFVYEDGSSIIMGLIQESSPCINNSGDKITRDPSDILYDGKTIVYLDFTNDEAGRREFRANLEANYQYGSYKIIMKNAKTSVSNVASDTIITNDSSYATYRVNPSNVANIYGILDIAYSDTLYDTTAIVNNVIMRIKLTCGAFTIDVDTNSNIK